MESLTVTGQVDSMSITCQRRQPVNSPRVQTPESGGEAFGCSTKDLNEIMGMIGGSPVVTTMAASSSLAPLAAARAATLLGRADEAFFYFIFFFVFIFRQW